MREAARAQTAGQHEARRTGPITGAVLAPACGFRPRPSRHRRIVSPRPRQPDLSESPATSSPRQITVGHRGLGTLFDETSGPQVRRLPRAHLSTPFARLSQRRATGAKTRKQRRKAGDELALASSGSSLSSTPSPRVQVSAGSRESGGGVAANPACRPPRTPAANLQGRGGLRQRAADDCPGSPTSGVLALGGSGTASRRG